MDVADGADVIGVVLILACTPSRPPAPHDTAPATTPIPTTTLSPPSDTSQTSPTSTTPLPDGRGTWAWADDAAYWGTTQVVGDPSREAEAVALMQTHAIDRVYGAYRSRPVDEPETIAAWNQRLHAAGLSTHLLLSETVWPCDPDAIRPLIQDRFVAFNASRTDPTEHFDGLHLDVEPHGLHGDRPECPGIDWATADDATRQSLLDGLATLYEVSREEVGPSVPIHADLPVWYDSEAQDPLAWFTRIDATLDGVTLMAFCREDLDRITEGVQYEVDTLDAVRIGLSAEHLVGATGVECQTWTDADHLLMVAAEVEAALGPIDLQSFSLFADEVD